MVTVATCGVAKLKEKLESLPHSDADGRGVYEAVYGLPPSRALALAGCIAHTMIHMAINNH